MSMKRRKNVEPIPTDLIIEILSRFSAKSIGKYRCLSKLWGSILSKPYFTDLFLTRSSARPQLLFAYLGDDELIFSSTPQGKVHDANNDSSPVAANYLTRFPLAVGTCVIYSPIRGLVYLMNTRSVKGKKTTVQVICNPTTGHSLTLPKMKTRRILVRSFFGYDPIDKQFKVLAMSLKSRGENQVFEEHQVLTLGSANKSWRMIKCFEPHYSLDKGICIDGVLYYQAAVNNNKHAKISMIVCFDVRSEKFTFVEVMETFKLLWDYVTLVNYNGKLGLVHSQGYRCVDGASTSIGLWVLKDAKKQEWLKHKYPLPIFWPNIVRGTNLRFIGVTTNEIVLSTMETTEPFCVFYYNMERNTIIKVEVQGLKALKGNRIDLFSDHVENLKKVF